MIPTDRACSASVRVVHGFAVTSKVFQPLLRRLNHRSIDATLVRYPSVGLRLNDIVERLISNLLERPPDGIVAHSLGCFVVADAICQAGWRGPVVLIAPPFRTLPLSRLIPPFLHWPFAPLLDHRRQTSRDNYRPANLNGCQVKTISGRFDWVVPTSCSGNHNLTILPHTHNSVLFSATVAKICRQWILSNTMR